MKKLFLISLSLLLSVTVSLADTYTDENGVTWTYSINGDNVTITKAQDCGETVVVPGSINGKNVTKLEFTFEDNTTIKNVTVPTTVTSLGWKTFWNCTRLLHVYGLNNCTTIGAFSFSNCKSLKSVDLLECITLESSAFNGCGQLTDIGSLAKCQSIQTSALNGCEKLTSIDNLEGLISLGEGAFGSCKELSATINLDVFTSIPRSAFENCGKMNFVGKFGNCTNIGQTAFYGCSNFTDVKIESNVLLTIGYNAFPNCKSIEPKIRN